MFWPNISETYYAYKMVPNNRGLFVEIDVLTGYKFDKMDRVIRCLLDTRKDTFYDKLFPLEISLGPDLTSFCDFPTTTGRVFFNKVHHPVGLMRNERISFFMTIENQKKLSEKDDFSSSDDENFLSPTKVTQTRSNKDPKKASSPKHQNENPMVTPKRSTDKNHDFKTPDSPVIRRKKRKRLN